MASEPGKKFIHVVPQLPNPARHYQIRYKEPYVKPGKQTVCWEEKIRDLETEDYHEAEKRAKNFLSRGGVVVQGKTYNRERMGDMYQ